MNQTCLAQLFKILRDVCFLVIVNIYSKQYRFYFKPHFMKKSHNSFCRLFQPFARCLFLSVCFLIFLPGLYSQPFSCYLAGGDGEADHGTDPSSDCIYYIKINFHYVLRDGGTGNFTETTDGSGGSFNGYQHADSIVKHMNNEFTSNQAPFLPKPTPPASAGDTKIRFVLSGVYFDEDDNLHNSSWNTIANYDSWRQNYGSEINIFIGRDSSLAGDQTSGMSGVAPGLNLNPNDALALIYNAHNEYIRYKAGGWWVHSTAATINHEIGHLAGLAHNIECSTGVPCPTGCFDGDDDFGITDTYFPGFRCWEYGNPSCQSLCSNWDYVGNYFMDYTAYEPAITQQQINKLRSYFCNGGAGSSYRANLPNSFFSLPSSFRPSSGGSLFMNCTYSTNYTQYKIEVWKCSTGSFSCTTDNLGTYYNSGIVSGSAPNLNLSALGTLDEECTYRALLTVYNNPCSPTHTNFTCVYILPPLLRSMVISPNPSSTSSTLSYELTEPIKELSVRIFPVTAKANFKELNKEKNKNAGKYNQQIDLGNLAPGIYTIEIIANNSSFTRNLSVIK